MKFVVDSFHVVTTGVDDWISLKSANAMVDSFHAAITGVGTGNVMKSVMGSRLWVWVRAPVILYPQCESVSPNARTLISYSG